MAPFLLQELPALPAMGNDWLSFVAYILTFIVGGVGMRIWDRKMTAKEKQADREAEREKTYLSIEEKIYEKLEKRFRSKLYSLEKQVKELAAEVTTLRQENTELRKEVERLRQENDQLRATSAHETDKRPAPGQSSTGTAARHVP